MRRTRIVQLSLFLTALLLSIVTAPNPAFAIYACPSMLCSEAGELCNGIGGTAAYQYVGVCYDPAYYPEVWHLRYYHNFTCNGSHWGTCTSDCC